MSKIICSPDLTSSTVGQILCAGKKKKFKEEGLVNENRQHKDIIVSKMKKKQAARMALDIVQNDQSTKYAEQDQPAWVQSVSEKNLADP